MALHIVFNLPKDKLIWDVGHQSYTHKILTGRKNQFDELRKFGGMSGFTKSQLDINISRTWNCYGKRCTARRLQCSFCYR